jgi:predicted Ser/Thr protein kinase
MTRRSGVRARLRGLEPEYTVVEEIGRGERAVVYLARDNVLNRCVAIKVLQPRFRRTRGAVQRFVRRARALARLQSAHAVDAYEVRRLSSGQPALVMRFVRGEALAALLARGGALAAERVERVVEQVGAALRAAHAQGLVHGAIDARHVMLDEETGDAVLLGFGAVAGEAGADGAGEGRIEAALQRQRDLYQLAMLGWMMLGDDEAVQAVADADPASLAARLRQVLDPVLAGRADDRDGTTERVVAFLAGRGASPSAAPAIRTTIPLHGMGATVVAAAAGVRLPRRVAAAAATVLLVVGSGTWLFAGPTFRTPVAGEEPAATSAAEAPQRPIPAAGLRPHRTGSLETFSGAPDPDRRDAEP